MDGRRTRTPKVKTATQQRCSSRIWNVKEKEALVEAVKKYGTLDLDKLADHIGTRTTSEVGFRLRSTILPIPKMPEDKLAPNVDLWCQTLCNSVDRYSRSEDFSAILADVMQTIAERHEVDEDQEINFGQIYAYLHNILGGGIPPIPGPTESLIIINLIKELSQILSQNSFEEEKNFLKNLYKRPSCPVPEDLRVKEFAGMLRFQRRNMKRKAAQNIVDQNITASQSVETADASSTNNCVAPLPSAEDEIVHHLSEFPVLDPYRHKFKMVIYGTNPLQIPTKFISRNCDFLKEA